LRIVSLASGSKGNACCIESDGRVLLVDCGISCRELRRRASMAQIDLQGLAGILVTHSHDDHVSGIKTLHKCFPDAPIFANIMTSETVACHFGIDDEAFVNFENGQTFDVEPFEVESFSIPHDTSDPVGYVIRAEGMTYFHGTDIGTPLDSVGARLAEADVATLESNHDPVMLRRSGRPPHVIQRIAGPRGHLSNDQACDLVRRFATPRLKRLALAHLSEQCNAPHLAEDAMRETLASIGRGDVSLKVLGQHFCAEI